MSKLTKVTNPFVLRLKFMTSFHANETEKQVIKLKKQTLVMFWNKLQRLDLTLKISVIAKKIICKKKKNKIVYLQLFSDGGYGGGPDRRRGGYGN